MSLVYFKLSQEFDIKFSNSKMWYTIIKLLSSSTLLCVYMSRGYIAHRDIKGDNENNEVLVCMWMLNILDTCIA